MGSPTLCVLFSRMPPGVAPTGLIDCLPPLKLLLFSFHWLFSFLQTWNFKVLHVSFFFIKMIYHYNWYMEKIDKVKPFQPPFYYILTPPGLGGGVTSNMAARKLLVYFGTIHMCESAVLQAVDCNVIYIEIPCNDSEMPREGEERHVRSCLVLKGGIDFFSWYLYSDKESNWIRFKGCSIGQHLNLLFQSRQCNDNSCWLYRTDVPFINPSQFSPLQK